MKRLFARLRSETEICKRKLICKRKINYDYLNAAVSQWSHAKEAIISGPVIMEKASEMARPMNIEFQSSNGWLARCKANGNVSFHKLALTLIWLKITRAKIYSTPTRLLSFSKRYLQGRWLSTAKSPLEQNRRKIALLSCLYTIRMVQRNSFSQLGNQSRLVASSELGIYLSSISPI